jgi:hypothetical protein
MRIEALEAAAHLLARSIIYSPVEAVAELGRRPRFLARALTTTSPWSESDVAALSDLFPWQGVAAAIDAGVFGTSVGNDEHGGLCVKVYTNERGQEHLKRHVLQRFHPEADVPICPVTVKSIDFAQARPRPCPGGESIGALGGSETGTLGGWLRKNPSRELVGISNNHVVAEFNRHGIGHPLIQPGPADGGVAADEIGQIDGVVQLKEWNGTDFATNLADVAWFRPNSSADADGQIGCTGRVPTGEEDLIRRYKTQSGTIAVWLKGRSSQAVTGSMTAIRASVFIRNASKYYYFEDQIEITMTGIAKGDSGSLVLSDPADKLGGLFFALDPAQSGVGFASSWDNVKSATGLDFWYH